MWDNDERFRVLFYETGMGIALVDLERKILDVNPAFERMLGYARAELLGNVFGAMLHPGDNALNLRLHEELLAGKREVYHIERRYIRKDQSVMWARVTISLLRTKAGEPSFTMGVMEDISETKTAQAKLEDMERGLVESAKMSALGEMAGGIAHEIQNPLTIIRFRAELLRNVVKAAKIDPTLGAQLIEHAEQIESTAVRISGMVKGLKSFIRKGDHDPFVSVELKTIFHDTVEMCRDRFYHHNVSLQVTMPPSGLKLDCRATQIIQVVINLLNNSFDAIQPLPDKWVKLSFEDHADSIAILVTDCGPGIPPEVERKLFQRFFTTKPVGKGTGIGLSISRDIAESHHGQLTIDPAAGNTCFVLHLPKEQSKDQPKAA